MHDARVARETKSRHHSQKSGPACSIKYPILGPNEVRCYHATVAFNLNPASKHSQSTCYRQSEADSNFSEKGVVTRTAD